MRKTSGTYMMNQRYEGLDFRKYTEESELNGNKDKNEIKDKDDINNIKYNKLQESKSIEKENKNFADKNTLKISTECKGFTNTNNFIYTNQIEFVFNNIIDDNNKSLILLINYNEAYNYFISYYFSEEKINYYYEKNYYSKSKYKIWRFISNIFNDLEKFKLKKSLRDEFNFIYFLYNLKINNNYNYTRILNTIYKNFFDDQNINNSEEIVSIINEYLEYYNKKYKDYNDRIINLFTDFNNIFSQLLIIYLIDNYPKFIELNIELFYDNEKNFMLCFLLLIGKIIFNFLLEKDLIFYFNKYNDVLTVIIKIYLGVLSVAIKRINIIISSNNQKSIMNDFTDFLTIIDDLQTKNTLSEFLWEYNLFFSFYSKDQQN